MKCPGCGSDEPVDLGDALLWCSECGGTFALPGRSKALNEALRAGSVEGQHEMKPLCRSCGVPLTWPRTDDPRSEECNDCLAEAHGGPENPAWSM